MEINRFVTRKSIVEENLKVQYTRLWNIS